jgi:hypothetical protein
MNPLYLPDQIDRMAKRQNNEKLAIVMSGLTWRCSVSWR